MAHSKSFVIYIYIQKMKGIKVKKSKKKEER